MKQTSKVWRVDPKRPYTPKNPEVTSRVMASIKNKNNKAEVALRKELWNRGMRYRLYDKKLIGSPDIVFKSKKVVIFVDGDFWHARCLVEEGIEALKRTLRTSKIDWWLKKLERNVNRDKLVTQTLESQGWRVFRIWESEAKENLKAVADEVQKYLGENAN